MDWKAYYRFEDENEKPLDRIVEDGGLCGILRTVGCIGDSLASGEFESLNAAGEKGYHDMFEYSWGQFMAQDCGFQAYNFSRGGMTAREYMDSFAEANDFWSDDKVCQAYIIALGVNDIINAHYPVGGLADIDFSDWRNNNRETFAGCYAAIVQRLLEKQPKARFFFVTMPRDENGSRSKEHTAFLYELAGALEYAYVIDLDKYAPVYDAQFRRYFFMGGHMNAAGYAFTAKMFESYIDYIIRHNPEDFMQIGFVGTEYHNTQYKW
ncbi:MAG: SGNH/GDSL hydrolase family protein [Clostridia bacterium]|nr:SGNH/GDSL hydrolase family protein [Clostridia bacterium]